MFSKLNVVMLVTLSLSFSQSNVNLSGIVQDNDSKAIGGATVKLLGKNMTAVTDAGGTFTISSVSVVQSIPAQQSRFIQFLGNKGLHLNNSAGNEITISLYDLSGRKSASVFSSKENSGMEYLFQSKLHNGVYICNVITNQDRQSIKFLVSDNNLFTIYKENNQNAGTHTFSASTAAVDSLLVTKNGYNPTKIPLDNLTKSGLKIILTDSISSSDATIVPDPSWTCFMPNGIPPPELGTKVFTIEMQYQTKYNVGKTKFGTRRFFDVKSGSIDGSKLKGTLYSGGLDLELTLSNGSTELEQIVIIKTNDDKPILMRNAGVAPSGTGDVRVVLDFEAPNSSSYTWLHTGKFAATRIVDTIEKTISMDVYDISNVTLPATKVRIKDPSDVTNQTWECLKWTGTSGATVITENVSCGGSINIGATKNGSRNIVPILGGTTTDKVVGKILNGGADYQMNGGLDARYTLAPNDGEFILVRNCGSNGLVPVFEARVDGPYAFLNENKYLSDSPIVTMTSTGMNVKILFHEMK